MEKRYTVFVSSTYTDMIDERNAVIQAIMRAGHIPLGMEAFGAANASSWKVITKTIDAADYYVLLIARRYGSINKAVDLGYTEQEFRYAVEKEVPVLVFLLDDTASWPGNYSDTEADAVARLKAFRTNASQDRQVAFWHSKADLPYMVMTALTNAFSDDPRPGWVRPEVNAGPGVAEELARLIKERDELSRLASLQKGDSEVSIMLTKLDSKKFHLLIDGINTEISAKEIFRIVGQILSTAPTSLGEAVKTLGLHMLGVRNNNPSNLRELDDAVSMIALLGLILSFREKNPELSYNNSNYITTIISLSDFGRIVLREMALRE